MKTKSTTFKVQYYSEMYGVTSHARKNPTEGKGMMRGEWRDAPLSKFPMGKNKAAMEEHAENSFKESKTQVRVVPVADRELVAA